MTFLVAALVFPAVSVAVTVMLYAPSDGRVINWLNPPETTAGEYVAVPVVIRTETGLNSFETVPAIVIVGAVTRLSWAGSVIARLGAAASYITVLFAEELLPARSVAVISMVFMPDARFTVAEKLLPLMLALTGGALFSMTVTVEVSSTVPVTVETSSFVKLLSAGAVTVSAGAASSSVIVLVSVIVLPAVSAATVSTMFAPD
jgi:hypothetical protein